VVLLAGCATGSVDDSRRFQAIDAEQTPQMPGAQATQFARTFGTPEASPEPTITPHAVISDLVLASSVSGSGSPGNTISAVQAGSQTVYAVARIAHIQPGQAVAALWRAEDGTVLTSVEQTPPPSSSPQWVSFAFQPAGMARGTYSIAIFVENDLLESIAFQVQ
jgi:hypothetical protein